LRPAASTAALGLVLLLAAALFDAEPLYVPGAAFVVLAATCAAWVAGAAHGVRVERTVSARRVQEDEPVRVEVRVRGGRILPPACLIDEPLLSEPAPVAFGFGSRAAGVTIDARFARRGRHTLAPAGAIVRDPIGLAARVVVGRDEDELLVLPRIEPVGAGRAGPDAGGDNRRVARSGRPSAAAEVDLDGLRPYREGTPASRIFWQALARGGDLMERRLRAEDDTRPLVVLDPRVPARDEDLDAAVRAAASLVVHLARHGGCAVLLPGDRRAVTLDRTLTGWPRLHARLALVGPGARPALASVAARRGPVLYVAARVLTRPPRALLHAPGGGRVLVVPGTLSGRRPVLAVAGCTGYEIGAPVRVPLVS
jgi:uncharacterized protein (DUF58 family)